MDGWIDVWMGGFGCMDRCMDGWMWVCVDEWMGICWVGGFVWMEEWMDVGWVYEWMAGIGDGNMLGEWVWMIG